MARNPLVIGIPSAWPCRQSTYHWGKLSSHSCANSSDFAVIINAAICSFLKFYLFIWLHRVLVLEHGIFYSVACELLVLACGI